MAFIDWVSCAQNHAETITGEMEQQPNGFFARKGNRVVPVIQAGLIATLDENGDIVRQFFKPRKHLGSFDTSVQIKSDGNRVMISGNVGAFGRPDNLFNFEYSDTIILMNRILESCDLPPMSKGVYYDFTKIRKGIKSIEQHYTGAQFSRFDMTSNKMTGNQANAQDFIYWLMTQKLTRGEMIAYGKGETAVFNNHSRYTYSKAYNKYVQLEKHFKDNDDEHTKEVIEYCRVNGVVRFETSLKQRFLNEKKIKDYGMFGQLELDKYYKEFEDKIMSRLVEVNNINELSGSVLGTYHAYTQGEDMKRVLPRTTFYRHRAELIKYGVDISVPNNVISLKVKPRIIDVSPLDVPDWYSMSVNYK